MFNKKFKKLPERWEWDYEINLTEDAPKELNAKALNQWLDEQLKVELIVKSSSWYVASYFYILKKDGSL